MVKALINKDIGEAYESAVLALTNVDDGTDESKGSKGRATSSKNDPSAELDANETEAYRIKMGRWRRDTVRTVLDHVWWAAIRIMRISHEPITHHFRFLHSSDHKDKVAQLVYEKAAQIMSEFSSLFSKPDWANHLFTSAASQQLSHTDKLMLLELGVEAILCHAGGYNRRVVRGCDQFPLNFMWFCHQPADVVCFRRKYFAQQVMATIDERLESTARRLKALFRDEIDYTAKTGLCKPMMWSFSLALRYNIRSDVCINESHNSLIKGISARCRRIGLPLLSGRCNVKRELGTGTRGAVSRWSKVRLWVTFLGGSGIGDRGGRHVDS